MTVAELIAELEKCPMEFEVFDDLGIRVEIVQLLDDSVELITVEEE